MYKYNCWRHYNSTYEYKQRFVLNKDYKAERKLIWGHAGKNEAKLALTQEFERKTISACKPFQGLFPALIFLAFAPPALAPPAPASASQKSKSNPPDKQKRQAPAIKDPECQAPNPDTSRKKV